VCGNWLKPTSCCSCYLRGWPLKVCGKEGDDVEGLGVVGPTLEAQWRVVVVGGWRCGGLGGLGEQSTRSLL
jgi:hypothetical protein